MTDNYEKELFQIKSAIKDYELATGVNCYLLDDTGKRIGDRTCYQCHHVCEFIQKLDDTGICTRDYLQSCSPALQDGKAQTYQCPFGLVNIAVPILPDEDSVFFVSSGPLLLEPPNKFLIDTFLERGQLLRSRSAEVYQMLQGIPLFDGNKVIALGNTLQRTVFPATNYHWESGHQKENMLVILGEKLRREFRLTLYPEFLTTAHVFEKELDLISFEDKTKPESWKKALEMLLSIFVKEVYKYDSFEETRHRAALFFLVLIQAGKRQNVNQEHVFGEQYVNIEKLLSASSYTSLNQVINDTIDRFQLEFFRKADHQNNKLILEAMSYIRQHYMDITLKDVAKQVALNPSYFSYSFKKYTGQSYSEYLNKVRIDASKQFLRDEIPLSEIAQNTGFTDQSYYIKVFKRFEGISPCKWKKISNPGGSPSGHLRVY
ncbi:MAG TPA: AraC family transcriptional regulator [Clostridiales bacterium]|nr:AraC family transcriptional regulator [Clostridiales bacterium]